MSEPSEPERFELRLSDELTRFASAVHDPRPTVDIAAAAMATKRRWWSAGAPPRTLVPILLLLGLAAVGAVVGGQLIRDHDATTDRSVVVVPSPQDSADPVRALMRREWSLRDVATNGRLAPIKGTLAASLRIDGQLATGKLDCRGYTAHVAIAGNSLVMRDPGSTSNTCTGSVADLEAGYLRALGEIAAWSVADGMLTLSDATGAPLLTYAPAPPPDLEGIWAVGPIVGGDGRQVTMPAPMTMLFSGGRITTTVDCAGVEARYAQDGTVVRISDEVVMDGQCPGPMPAADALRSALQASVLVDTEGDTVLLLDAQRGLRIILGATRPQATPIPASSTPSARR